MVVLLLALAVLLAWLSTRYPYEADWTSAGRHSLSQASRDVLARMKGELHVSAYARPQPDLRETIERFVRRYQRVRPDIKLEFVNPDAVPDEVRSLGVSVNGELVLHYNDRVEHVRSDSEEEFTNALQRLLRGQERWLAFLDGHGERSAVGKANYDLGAWARQLKSRGINFQPLNLGDTHSIPDNTSVLVIAGPQVDLLPGEVQLVIDFLDRGGDLLWLTDPGPQHGLEPLAAYLGIELPAGVVVDATTQLVGIKDASIALVTEDRYADHAALEHFRYTTLFPKAGAVIASPHNNWHDTTLFTSSKLSWLETGALGHEAVFEQDKDMKGPVPLAVALSRDQTVPDGDKTRTVDQRAIVVGDGDFLSNEYVGNTGNLELGMRLVNWLTRDENFIDIPARTADDTQLEMDSTLLGMLGVFFLFVLPGALLGTGLYAWWRRRRA